MLSKFWIVSALGALAVSAAPTLPTSKTAGSTKPAEMTIMADYFKLLGENVASLRGGPAPVCDFSKASMPVASPTPLPPVGPGLFLKHVAVGRGIQNYTCDTTNATALPVAIGAIATLYDATCLASTFPSLLAFIPPVSLQFNPTSPLQTSLAPSNIVVSGQHYFDSAGIPIFDLDTTAKKIGTIACSKQAGVNAPSDAVSGQGSVGNGSVQWLKLVAKRSTGGLQEVYRINTAGGKPPATCVGQEATFEVEYAAEYWFYGLNE